MSIINLKMSRRTAMISLLGATAATGIVACSSQSRSKEGTIEMWDYLGQGVSNTAMEVVVAAFQKKNPDLKIHRTSFAYSDLSKSIVQGGAGGQVPDIAVVDVVDNQNLASLGLLKDLTSALGTKSSEFYEGPWKSTQLDSKTYGVPLNSNNLGLFYNKDLLSAAGLQPPTTWEELKTAAQATTQGEVTGLAVSAIKNEQGTFQFLPFVWQTGGDLDTYSSSGAEALAYLKGLIDSGAISSAVTNYSQEDARTQFTAGKVAMMMNGPWELQNLTDVGFEWGVAALPAGKRAATGLGGENVVVMQEGPNAEAAMKLAEFLAGAEGAKTYCDQSGQLSARPDLAGKLALSGDPNMQIFEKQLDVAHARAYGKDYAKISEAIQQSVQEALTGAATPEAAAANASTSITQLLKDAK